MNIPMQTPMQPAMQLALEANFGSVESWREAFMTLARSTTSPSSSLGTPPAQVLLRFQPLTGALVHQVEGGVAASAGVNEPAEAKEVLLRLPANAVAQHDPNTFVACIAWDDVYARYQHAVHAASKGLGADHSAVAQAVTNNCLLDVRREGMYDLATTLIPGARWHNPVAVAAWAQDLPRDRDVLVYCIYGHEVGRTTALRLRAAGVQAKYLNGGIDGWQNAGLPLAHKPEVQGDTT
jgi:superoxide dismutase, Fe-Mn family